MAMGNSWEQLSASEINKQAAELPADVRERDLRPLVVLTRLMDREQPGHQHYMPEEDVPESVRHLFPRQFVEHLGYWVRWVTSAKDIDA